MCGEAGLKRRTRFGNATLMIAANLPDVDVLAFATSIPAVALRRGWTHGIVAQALLPVLLTGIVLLAARLRPARDGGPPARVAGLLLLSYIGVLSHVSLDLLNNYGVRLLAPLNWRWFYGDAVFILDPWLWLTLGLGVHLSRRRASSSPSRAAVGPARIALGVAAVYIAGMCLSARTAREEVIEAWRVTRASEPRGVMAGPVPVSPFQREVIVDAGDHYATGRFAWWPRRVAFDGGVTAKNDTDPAVARAREAPHIRAFLVWARFPFWTVEPGPDGTRVTVSDMRFGGRGGGFVQRVVVP